jgi:hypothetical protein
MNPNRHVLVLYSSDDAPVVVTQLAEAITRLGSTAVVRKMCNGQYDKILDAVAIADTVIYWPTDKKIGPDAQASLASEGIAIR